MRGDTLHVVPCSATKSRLLEPDGPPLPARSAYAGAAFLAAREYLEAHRLPWVILSARYGLVWPGDLVAWYDERLTAPPWDGEWAGSLDSMTPRQYGRVRAYRRVVVLGGALYCDHAAEILERPVERPLAGLGIGQQIRALQWGTWRRAMPSPTVAAATEHARARADLYADAPGGAR